MLGNNLLLNQTNIADAKVKSSKNVNLDEKKGLWSDVISFSDRRKDIVKNKPQTAIQQRSCSIYSI